MSRQWEPTTLRLTAKQARVLWHVLTWVSKPWPTRPGWATSLAAILRKLETHEHRWFTDEDGACHPCRCGKGPP